jgi:hypothetical protein
VMTMKFEVTDVRKIMARWMSGALEVEARIRTPAAEPSQRSSQII